jgi:choline dehydrogenase-like flavoprotein
MSENAVNRTSGDKVDVVIVGAGAAGAILGSRLAAEKKSVVILEYGPNWKLTDLYSSQIWSRRIKWGGSFVEAGGKNPVGNNFNVGWGNGGSAIHHYAQWPRMHPQDFRGKTLFGRGVDWPISYDDLRPYYDRVQEEVGISGDAAREPWRPPGAPYPMPPLKLYPQAEVLAAGFAKIGVRLAPMPLAILSQSYKGRPPCIYDGWCDAGCPIGALANPLVTDLPAAVAAGAQLRNDSPVTRVLMSKDGRRAIGVEYFDRTRAERREQYADVVIVANNCIQGSRLLLNSATAQHPHGLANSSGTLGQYVMTHFSAGLTAMFDVDTQPHMGTTGASLIGQDAYAKPGGSYTWFVALSHKLTDLLGMANVDPTLFGEELHRFVRRAVKGIGSMTAIAEQSPRADNRIVLGSSKDSYGYPIARWENSIDEREQKLFKVMRDEGLRATHAAGATQVWAPETVGFQHLAGGLRMGSSAADSVCDSYGRCHEIPNLVVAGGGIFPTEGAVNPTFTVHALTHRTADHLAANWGSYAA